MAWCGAETELLRRFSVVKQSGRLRIRYELYGSRIHYDPAISQDFGREYPDRATVYGLLRSCAAIVARAIYTPAATELGPLTGTVA